MRSLDAWRTTVGAGSSARGEKVRVSPQTSRSEVAIRQLTQHTLQRTSLPTNTGCCSNTPGSKAAAPGATLTTHLCNNFVPSSNTI